MKRIFNLFKPKSSKYWDARYQKGGNSGAGSYGKLAEFKRKVIDDFAAKNKISSIIEFGSGDGNQISLLNYKGTYIGLDISSKSVELCSVKFKDDQHKKFILFSGKRGFCKGKNLKAELTISLDVIYHLVEDTVYNNYIYELFSSSEKYVIVYSTNDNSIHDPSWHVKHRRFTDTIKEMFPEFHLNEVIRNEYTQEQKDKNGGEGSDADFYIFKKISK